MRQELGHRDDGASDVGNLATNGRQPRSRDKRWMLRGNWFKVDVMLSQMDSGWPVCNYTLMSIDRNVQPKPGLDAEERSAKIAVTFFPILVLAGGALALLSPGTFSGFSKAITPCS